MASAEDDAFEPEPRARAIGLRLVMERSLTKAELAEYDAMSADDAYARARSMKTLHAEWSNIGEISNLEPFESAEVLYIQHNRIERIENLDCMPRLQFLALQGNRIKRVENLLCLSQLEFLDLSKNQIAVLDEKQLPETVNILNLQDNPCTTAADYAARVRARLPDLIRLDGVDADAEDDGASSSRALPPSFGSLLLGSLSAVPEELLATEKGLGAYWRKGEMQSNVEAAIRDEIQAYSVEALADVDGFDQQLEDASARSRARREGVARQMPGGAGSRPGTASSLAASLRRALDLPDDLAAAGADEGGAGERGG